MLQRMTLTHPNIKIKTQMEPGSMVVQCSLSLKSYSCAYLGVWSNRGDTASSSHHETITDGKVWNLNTQPTRGKPDFILSVRGNARLLKYNKFLSFKNKAASEACVAHPSVNNLNYLSQLLSLGASFRLPRLCGPFQNHTA